MVSWIVSQAKSLITDKSTIAFGFGIFLAIVVSAGFNLIDDSVGINLITSLSILLALSKYAYEKERDRKNEIVDMISFFREEVIGCHTKFGNLILEKFGSGHEFVKIQMEEVTIKWVRNHHSAKAEKQAGYIYDSYHTRNCAVNAMNALEEFSAKVKILKAMNSPELEILYPTFVMVFEDLAVLVLAERELGPGETMFRNSVELYNLWSRNVSRDTYQEKKSKLYKELGIKK